MARTVLEAAATRILQRRIPSQANQWQMTLPGLEARKKARRVGNDPAEQNNGRRLPSVSEQVVLKTRLPRVYDHGPGELLRILGKSRKL